MRKRRIAILGSTGSIGRQALDVIRQHRDLFEVELLTANNNSRLLAEQAIEFDANNVVICNSDKYTEVSEALRPHYTKVFAGMQSVCDLVAGEDIDIVLTAMVGFSGLESTVAALKAGKIIALANKETLVVAGELITRLVQEHHASILPIDSEHGAIFQCIVGEHENEVEKVILTASGGPFRTYTKEQLAGVRATDALKHPTWNMGAKITIDSATLMNKGFEVIEAKWLFGLRPEQIEVVVHPQSVIHSMVQFRDSSVKAQMGWPDMRLPIQYALTYPERRPMELERLDFTRCTSLTFEQPDTARFRNLAIAYEAMGRGGNIPCVMNAANEVAVDAYLHDRVGFTEMSDIIETVIGRAAYTAHPTYEEYVECDKEARAVTRELIR